MAEPSVQEINLAKVNLETAQIAWSELQRYFAGGVALSISTDMDLVEVACQISQDNTSQIKQWVSAGKVGKVSDEQAKAWLSTDEIMWAVVVSPWVLVQPVRKPQ